jgi:hypothetical protein
MSNALLRGQREDVERVITLGAILIWFAVIGDCSAPTGPSDDRFLRRPSPPPPPPPAPPTVVSGIVTDSPYHHPVHGARVEWVGIAHGSRLAPLAGGPADGCACAAFQPSAFNHRQ